MGQQHQITYRADYERSGFEIDFTELTFELRLPTVLVTARICFQNKTGKAPLVLSGTRLLLKSVTLDGRALTTSAYRYTEKDLTILSPPRQGVLEVVTEIVPGDAGAEGLLYLDGVFITHCEPEGFRRITYFLDRPDIRSRYSCTLIADEKYYGTLLSNGHLVAQGKLADGRRFCRWEDPFPKAPYLFALVAGNLSSIRDQFVTRSGKVVELAVHTAIENLPFGTEGLGVLKRAMAWDEVTYGREYDLNVLNIAVVRDYPGGGMENKGLNLYTTERFLASTEIATDDDRRRAFAGIAHEYFHNWTGNRVGCRSWFELSLKEGFTLLRQQEFMASVYGTHAARIDDVVRLRDVQYPEDEGGTAHAVRPDQYISANNMYTRTVYEKGAEIVRSLKIVVGNEIFALAMQEYFRAYDGQATTIDAFLAMVSHVAQRDLTQFGRWYQSVGPVHLDVAGAYDPALQQYTLHLAQSGGDIGPLHIAVTTRLIDAMGAAIATRLTGDATGSCDQTLHLTATTGKYVFEDVAVEPRPSVLRGLSAPVRLSTRWDVQHLILLATKDTDYFVRWDAAQQLAVRAILGNGSSLAKGAWLHVVDCTLNDSYMPAGITGRILQLPSETLLAQQQSRINIDDLRLGRRAVTTETVRKFRDRLRAKYDELRTFTKLSDDEEVRRLRNVCLWYLMKDPQPYDVTSTWSQFRSRTPFENVWIAARLLVDMGGTDRRCALIEGRRQWRKNPRLLDYWFMVQMGSEADDCATMVHNLVNHPDFSVEHTTRIKSSLDTFVANQSAFHQSGGAGYDFVLKMILMLGPVNPRLAARFLRKFDCWTRVDERRGEMIRTRLQLVLSEPNLAAELYEIAHKSLELEGRKNPENS